MDEFLGKYPDKALQLYEMMLKIRITEESIAERYHPADEMRCPTHLSTGQEAVAAGVGFALKKSDFAVSSHRAHAHYLGKGGDLKRMLAEIYGKVTGCSSGKGGSMHLIDRSVGFAGSTAIVGNSIPVGVGLGLSIKLKNSDGVSCVFVGDGAIEEGVFYESVNFAAVKKLPVLFVCENNLYSVYSPLSVRQPEGRKIWQMVGGIGLAAQHAYGNDVLEVYAAVQDASQSIRDGEGPRFLEFDTYRWREHCGPSFDNDIGYRTEEEYLSWKKRDPIPLLEGQLIAHSILSSEDIEAIKQRTVKGVNDAFDYARTSPFPKPEEAFTQLYAD